MRIDFVTYRSVMCILFTIAGTCTWLSGLDLSHQLRDPSSCEWCHALCVCFVLYIVVDIIVMMLLPPLWRLELVAHHVLCIVIFCTYLPNQHRLLSGMLVMEVLSICNGCNSPVKTAIFRITMCLMIRLPLLYSLLHALIETEYAYGAMASAMFAVHDVSLFVRIVKSVRQLPDASYATLKPV